jgi:hypothetical protein
VKEFIEKENRYYNYIKGVGTTLNNLDSQEFSVQGIGQLSAISGDTDAADRNVEVNLTGIANAEVAKISFDVEIGEEIHSTKSSDTITITPNTGYTLTASDFSVSSTGSYVDSVTFAQSGANVVATINFTDGVNMPASDVVINLAVTGDAAATVYKLHDLNFDINNDSNITVTKSYLGSSNATAEPTGSATGFEATYDGSTFVSVATVTFDLDSGYNFKKPPQYKILEEDNLIESQYEITFQDKDSSNTDITIGVGGKTLEDVDKRIFTIKYKFPAQDTSNDKIQFNAVSVQAQAAESNVVNGYRFDGTTVVSRYAQTRNLYIYGASGATFTLGLNINSAGIKYWDGDSFETSSTTLTIPSAGIYTIPVEFYETSTSKAYVFTLAAVSPSTLLSPLMGNVYSSGVVQNPFTINQYADVTLTIAATSSNMTVTSSNFTSTATALVSPNEESSIAEVDVTFTATATGNISHVLDATEEEFTNYNSNNFEVQFESSLPSIDNSGVTKTLSYSGTMFVGTYGSADTTMTLDLDDVFNVAGGSGGAILLNSEVTGAGGGFINIGKLTYNDGTYSTTNGKVIHVGTADNTSISGTGTIYGNFFGNGINDITLAITPGTGNTDTGTSCFDNMTITKGTLTGSDASQDLTYTWTAQFDETITSSSIPDYNVQVSLTNEP